MVYGYYSYIKKYYQSIPANFCVHRNESYCVVWVTDEIQVFEEELFCSEVSHVTLSYVTLHITTHLIRQNSTWL
jgi:hypothetical protein